MTAELPVLLAAAGAVRTFVKETSPLVKAIRSGLLARNDNAKQELRTKLHELQQNLEHMAQLGRYTESYVRTHENLLQLASACRQAMQFLNNNLEDCRDRSSFLYAGNWRILETLFEAIDGSRGPALRVMLDRAKWYDEDDKARIALLLDQFTSAFDRASAHLRGKVADDLLHELEAMSRPLRDADTLLRNTIFDKILPALQQVG